MYKEEKIYTRRTMTIEGKDHYYLSFRDAVGSVVDVEVGADAYDAVREFELIEARIAWSDRRHVERFALSNEEIDKRARHEHTTTEKTALLRLCSDEIAKGIEDLTCTQRRRFLLHRFKGMTLKEISIIEGASVSVVHHSVRQAEKKLKKIMKNFSNGWAKSDR